MTSNIFSVGFYQANLFSFEIEKFISLEVFNAIGEMIVVLVVSESQIELLMNNEVLHIRVLDEAV